MHYSDDPAQVRVDFFKPSGKWYTTEQITWLDYNDCLIHDTFARSLREHLVGRSLSEFDAVCLEPYHEHSHPIMLRAGKWLK